MLPFLLPLIVWLPSSASPPVTSASPQSMSPGAVADDEVVRGEAGAKLRTYLQRAAAFGFRGVAHVEQNGARIYLGGHGLADTELHRRNDAATVFDLGSLGKQFTATAILLLQQQGELELDESIELFVDDVPADKAEITIHQLLCHCSGLPYHGSMQEALQAPLSFVPGERFQYSNPGYRLLAEVIERCSGRSFSEFLRDEVFAPAGLESTFVLGTADAVPDGLQEKLAQPYDERGQPGVRVGAERVDDFLGAGNVWSTACDLARWIEVLSDGDLLDKERRAQLFAPHAAMNAAGLSYGYGWMVAETERGTRAWFHAGQSGEFHSDARIYPDEGRAIVLLANAGLPGATADQAVLTSIARLAAGEEVPMPPAIAEPPSDGDAWVGRYTNEQGNPLFEVSFDDGAFTVQCLHDSALEVFAPADDGVFATMRQSSYAIVESALRGDLGPVARSTHRALVGGGVDTALRRLLADVPFPVDPKSCESIGGFADGVPGNGRTYVRLRALDDSADAILVELWWMDGRLRGVSGREHVLGQRFVAAVGGELVRYDLTSGRAVTLARAGNGVELRGSVALVGLRDGG